MAESKQRISRQKKLVESKAAFAAYLAGASWAWIAERFDFATPAEARTRILTFQAETYELDDVADMRRREDARLNRALMAVWPTAIASKITDEDGNEHSNPDQFPAMDRALRIMGDIRKLHGLEAPSQVVMHNASAEEIFAMVERFKKQELETMAGEADIWDAEVVEEVDDGRLAEPIAGSGREEDHAEAVEEVGQALRHP